MISSYSPLALIQAGLALKMGAEVAITDKSVRITGLTKAELSQVLNKANEIIG